MKHRQTSHCLAFAALLLLASVALADSPSLEYNKERFAINAMRGKPAPELKLTEWFNSKALTPDDLKGKIVIVNFWATWCATCVAGIPEKNRLAEKYADQGVVIIGVCSPDGGDHMHRVAKRYGLRYPIGLDADKSVAKAFLTDGVPDFYVIDRAGNLRWGDILNKDLEKAITLLLAEDK